MPYNYILKDKLGGRIDSNTDVIYGKESNQANGGKDVIKGLGGLTRSMQIAEMTS
jgi:hypothetical protein